MLIQHSSNWFYEPLSEMEQQVLQLTADEIAAYLIPYILYSSEATINEYWRRIKRKLRASNKVHAVAIALHLGIIH